MTTLQLAIDSLDDIDEMHRQFYEPDPNNDGAYRLKVSGIDKLRNAKNVERDLRKSAENRVRELETQVADLRGKPRPKPESEMTPRERFIRENAKRLNGLEGDAYAAEFAKIESEMQPLIDAAVAEYSAKLQARAESLERTCVNARRGHEARAILKDIAESGCAEILMPHVMERIGVERRGEEWALIVMDATGKPTSMTVDALKDELRDSPAFKRLVKGSTADEAAAHARKVQAAITAPKAPIH